MARARTPAGNANRGSRSRTTPSQDPGDGNTTGDQITGDAGLSDSGALPETTDAPQPKHGTGDTVESPAEGPARSDDDTGQPSDHTASTESDASQPFPADAEELTVPPVPETSTTDAKEQGEKDIAGGVASDPVTENPISDRPGADAAGATETPATEASGTDTPGADMAATPDARTPRPVSFPGPIAVGEPVAAAALAPPAADTRSNRPSGQTGAQSTANAPARRGLLGPIMGGLVAAAIGAGTVLYVLPQGWQPAPAPDLSGIEARIGALETRPAPELPELPPPPDLEPLEARIAALEAAPEPTVELPDIDRQIASLLTRLDTLEASVAGIDLADAQPDLTPLQNRISALEARPEVDLTPLTHRIAALESALPQQVAGEVAEQVAGAMAAAQSALDAREQELAVSAEQVAVDRVRAEVLAALGDLGLAADTGAPAEDALARIAEATDLPRDLAPFREGLPTLAALQAGFPSAARAALAAAPAPEDAGAGDRVLNFLRNQTGARSLAPRAGNDPDAVLSRAEAFVRQGDLPSALNEIDTLPARSAAALSAWRVQAEQRLAALAALTELSARLGQDQDTR